MFDKLQLIAPKYCTGYRYLSDSALDVHFHIVFAATIVYKRKQLPGIWGILSGESPKMVELKREKLFSNYGMKQVRWFNLDTGKRASLDEEVKLNHIKHQIIDKRYLSDGKAGGSGRKRAGKGETFAPKTIEVVQEHAVL